jgi:hypothetical protein
MNNMSYESLTWFKGDIHVRMGESKYGCTDSDEYFDLLAQEWDEVDIGTRDQMRYDGMYDYFEVYKRKK